MKAIVIKTENGRPLEWNEVDAPSCSPDEVLVDIYASAVNRADLSQRAGKYPPPPGSSDILGLEMAGVISRRTGETSGWKEGDRVCALLPGGGYAEQVNVPHRMLMPIPDGLSFEQAAAIPEVFFTAYLNLFLEAALETGETVLIHGGASGVGTAAIQLARHAGCRVFVTAGTDEKAAHCRELGAELAVNYNKADFAARMNEYTGGDGVDVILDIVGGPYLERNLNLLKVNGRLVCIATLGGEKAEISLRTLMGRRLRLIGSVLRARSNDEKIKIKERFMDRFWGYFLDGSILPVIDTVFPIDRANEAHARMASNQNIGKIVLKVR